MPSSGVLAAGLWRGLPNFNFATLTISCQRRGYVRARSRHTRGGRARRGAISGDGERPDERRWLGAFDDDEVDEIGPYLSERPPPVEQPSRRLPFDY